MKHSLKIQRYPTKPGAVPSSLYIYIPRFIERAFDLEKGEIIHWDINTDKKEVTLFFKLDKYEAPILY